MKSKDTIALLQTWVPGSLVVRLQKQRATDRLQTRVQPLEASGSGKAGALKHLIGRGVVALNKR